MLVTATLVLGFLFVSRRAPTSAPAEAPRRGGQIVASIPQEPLSLNPLSGQNVSTDAVARLTLGTLVRIDPATQELQPWLADRWEMEDDGRVYRLRLRPGVTWSDGAPFTSEDVAFSVRAVLSPGAEPEVARRFTMGRGAPRVVTPDASTVVVTFAVPSGPGLRLFDALPILPKHKLERAFAAGSLATAWSSTADISEMVATGPFVVREYHPGRQVVLERNDRYWRRAPDGGRLPYLDRIVLRITPGGSGLGDVLGARVDLPFEALTLDEYAKAISASEEGRLEIVELGVSAEPNALWFCLNPEARSSDPLFAFIQRAEFRQAISYAVDRESFAHAVFQGAAVPIWGPVTPGNAMWFWPDVVRYPPDASQARQLLAGIGLEDRNGNGVLEDGRGNEVRIEVLTEGGVETYERELGAVREALTKVGVVLESEPVASSMFQSRTAACDFQAAYHRSPATSMDPAADLDFWLSAGVRHVWNPRQRAPGTEWERRIDTLALEQAASADGDRRKDQFILVQRTLAENLPIIYFAAPRLYYAHTARAGGIVPSIAQPYGLWNGDLLHVVPGE